MTLTPHPLLVPLVMKEYSYISTPPIGRTACTEPQCLYKGALYLYLRVELYLYSPIGRTACAESQCLYKDALYLYLRVELYLYSPYGPYGLYRDSVPVQGCTLPLPYSTAIPLLPLWTVRPVQSLSACTRVTFTFTLQ
jgi:hypothetical protein